MKVKMENNGRKKQHSSSMNNIMAREIGIGNR
jgi:hypothetical protein